MKRILLALLWLSTAAFASPDPRLPANQEELQQRVSVLADEYELPALTYAVIENGSVSMTGAHGRPWPDRDSHASDTTVFRVGSLTKLLTAIAVLQLSERGLLSLDDRINDLAPEVDLRNAWRETDPLRVVHLLEHTSGLPDMHPGNAYVKDGTPDIPLLVAINRDENSLQTRWRPGERFAYSNINYAIAGYLVEKASGRSIGEYFEDEIFAPLGMTHSAMLLSTGATHRLAQGYASDGGARELLPVYLRPAWALQSSARDMAWLVATLANGGVLDDQRLLSRTSMKRLTENHSAPAGRAGLPTVYRLGVYGRERGNVLWYCLDGGINGFSSLLCFETGQGRGFVLMSNRENAQAGLNEIADQLVTWLARDQAPQLSVDELANQVELERASGWYVKINPSRPEQAWWDRLSKLVHLRERDDRLVMQSLGGGSREYALLKGGLLRASGNVHASAVLHTNAATKASELMTSFHHYRRVAMPLALTPLALVTVAFVTALGVLVAGPVWIVQRLRRRQAMHGVPWLRSLLYLTALTLVISAALLWRADPLILAGANWRTTGFFFGSLGYLALTAVTLGFAVIDLLDKEAGQFRYVGFAMALVFVAVAALAVTQGVIGYRSWVM